MKNYKFIISGRVQGVYYRKNVHANSLKSNFKGYVKNLPDGTVEAGVTCDEHDLDIFIDILKKGSPNSEVKNIKILNTDELFENKFEIRY